jgi:hypothetical protein
MVASLAIAQTPPARTATLSLTPPTKFEDGSALDCSVAGKCVYNVYRGTCGAVLTKVVSNAANPASIPVAGSVPGQCFRATAIAEGAESDQSIEVRFKGKPGAPSLTIVITIEVQQ